MFSGLIKKQKKSLPEGKKEKILVTLHYCPSHYSPQMLDAVPRFSLFVGKKLNLVLRLGLIDMPSVEMGMADLSTVCDLTLRPNTKFLSSIDTVEYTY